MGSLRTPAFVLCAVSFQTAKALVSGIQPTGSNVPVAETAPCPPQHYRQQVLIFACGQQDGEVYFPLANVSKAALMIPKGIRNLKLTLDASGPVDITLIDPASHSVVANGTRSLPKSSVIWHDVTIEFTAGPSSLGTKEGVDFSGTLPRPLRVDLANRLQSQNLATITYSYDEFEGCSDIPVGCKEYDQVLAREWVYNWSTWVSMQYPKAAQAWQALASQAMRTQYGSSARAGPIPFHLWKGVWKKWPGAETMDWQVAFKFIDSLHTEDQLVEVVEFIRAYKIAGVGLSMFNWCTALQTQYPDSGTAWLAVAGPTSIAGIDYSRWKTAVWPSFVPPDDFAKASSAGSFQFADANNNGVVSKSEFAAIYESCDYKPSRYADRGPKDSSNLIIPVSLPPTTSTFLAPTTTAATTNLPTTPREEGGSEEQVVTDSSSHQSNHSAADLSSGGLNGGLLGGGLRVEPNRTVARNSSKENSTTSAGAATSTTAAGTSTTVPLTTSTVTSTVLCCSEANAECLACKAGLSVEKFCGDSQGVGVEGCPDTELADEHEEPKRIEVKQEGGGHDAVKSNEPGSPLWRSNPTPSPKTSEADNTTQDSGERHVTDCPYVGISYKPLLDDANESQEETISECQARCAHLAGCAYFSYRASGACNLHGPAAVWSLTTELGAVAGPAVCVANIGVHIHGVDFVNLSASQKRRLEKEFAKDIANITDLGASAVKDLIGRAASVTLSAGSLRARANLELPSGMSVSEAKEKLKDKVLSARFDESLRAADVLKEGVDESKPMGLDVKVDQGCYLAGTRYDAAPEPKGGDERLSVAISGKASNASDCQLSCMKEDACDYFSFMPSTGECLLRGGSAVHAISDEEAIGGPRECAGLPVVPYSDWGGAKSAGSVGEGFSPYTYIWCSSLGVALGLCSLGTVLLVLWSKRRKRKRGVKGGGGHKYAPLSRQDDEDGEVSPRSDGSPSHSEEENDNKWLEMDVHPLAMELVEDGDSREQRHAGRQDGPMHLAANSRELRNTAPVAEELQRRSCEAAPSDSLMHGFLGTEALKR